MNCEYNNLSTGVDEEGDLLLAKKLLYTARDYGEEELSATEKKILSKVYGEKWNETLKDL
jgi:hypothetical protein